MLKVLFCQKNFFTVSIIGLMCGILLACIEVVPGTAMYLEDAYLYARDGYIELSDREYSADVFNCLLNILLFIPSLAQLFTKDYEIAKSYVFVRINNTSKWYRYKACQSAVFCLYSASIYNLTLLLMVLIMGFKTKHTHIVFQYLLLGILANSSILFMLVMANNILCIKIKPHLSTSIVMGVTIIWMAITHFLNSSQVQFSLLTNYFISWHMTMNANSVFYHYPTWVYYAAIIAIIICELMVGNQVMKKVDKI